MFTFLKNSPGFTGLLSLILTGIYADYALENSSGHTGFPASLILLPWQVFAAYVAIKSIFSNGWRKVNIDPTAWISLIAAGGGIGFLFFLDQSGILREYDGWAHSGLRNPPENRKELIYNFLIIHVSLMVLIGIIASRWRKKQ